VEATAEQLKANASSQPLGDLDRHLIAARIDYLAARAWNESGDKKRAIPHFEAAIAAANSALQPGLKPGESSAALQALMKPLSELCLLKDMGFLVTNGPKISQYAKKILALEPGHVGALVTIASSKAYPPPVFGGNPKEAIAEMAGLLASHRGGFEKDELFDSRMCLATAEAKLGRADEARLWYDAALKLYPHNKYALEQRGKLNK
jgi:tetratricopeptide (TPR) repeat protein